ncbi:MAG TPA: hypothetical protein PKV44_07350 [Bacillota bacterium]|nr:hypothetical protein [Bacillota bacterium]HPE38160.1 hypothetical protein [Bacillota bacterium]
MSVQFDSKVIWMEEARGLSAMEHRYEDIISIEAELSGYRRGSLKASIDFNARMIGWQDTRLWSNDFMRALSPKNVAEIKAALPNTDLLTWATEYARGTGSANAISCSFPEDWSVIIKFNDGEELKSLGVGSFPAKWNDFRNIIEHTAKTAFRLR